MAGVRCEGGCVFSSMVATVGKAGMHQDHACACLLTTQRVSRESTHYVSHNTSHGSKHGKRATCQQTLAASAHRECKRYTDVLPH